MEKRSYNPFTFTLQNIELIIGNNSLLRRGEKKLMRDYFQISILILSQIQRINKLLLPWNHQNILGFRGDRIN